MSAIPGYMTVQEIAKRWGICYAQVARYVQHGRLPSIKIGRTSLVPIKEVEKFQRSPVGRPAFLRQEAKSKKS